MPHSPEIARLLDGLNPAQGAAVTSEAMPLAILAGAGSGQDPGANPPHRPPDSHRHREPQPDAGPHLHPQSRRANSRSVSAPSACGSGSPPARSTPLPTPNFASSGADTNQPAPQLAESKMRLVAPLVHARKSNAVQPVDVVSEIEWAKARLISPERYAETVYRPWAANPPLGCRGDGVDLRPLRGREEKARHRRLRRSPRSVCSGVSRPTASSPLASAGSSGTCSSTNSKTSTRPSTVCSKVGSALNPAPSSLKENSTSASSAIHESGHLCVERCRSRASSRSSPNGSVQAEVIRLEDNYRSTPQILTVADAVLGMGQRESRPLRANRPDGIVPTVTEYASDLDEARGIARAVRDRQSQRRPWSNFAGADPHQRPGPAVRGSVPGRGHSAQGPGWRNVSRSARDQERARRAAAVARATCHSRAGSSTSKRWCPKRSPPAWSALGRCQRTGGEPRGPRSPGQRVCRDRPNGHHLLVPAVGRWASLPPGPTNPTAVAISLRSPRSTEPRVWSGPSSSSPVWSAVMCRSARPTTRMPGTKSVVCSMSPLPGPSRNCTAPGPRPARSAVAPRVAIGPPWLDNIDAAPHVIGERPADGDWRAQLRLIRERAEAAKAAGVPGHPGVPGTPTSRSAPTPIPKCSRCLKKWRAAKARGHGGSGLRHLPRHHVGGPWPKRFPRQPG